MRACVFAVVASAAITAIGAPTAAGAEHDFGTITPTATGAAITVSTTAAGDTARVSFEGQANQRVHLKLGPINCGAVACADVYIKRASGANHTSKYVGKDGAYIETTLPATETYSIVVDPRSTYVVSESMTVYDVPPT
jgi:hypothetical protein